MVSAQRTCVAAAIKRLAGKWGRLLVGTGLIVVGGACFAPPEDAVRSTVTGDPLLLEQIDPILGNPRLTDEEKREELRELGLPEHLIDILFRA
jgi:hypothetical protein